jgi:hypothetical protein
MAAATDLYSADQVYITFGTFKLEGRGPDTFCKVERNKDSFSLKVGADGEAVRTRTLDRSGRVTVTLLQTAKVNVSLQAAMLADEASPNGVSILPLMVKDYGGNALWVSPEAWILRPANSEMGAESGTREWVFECANLAPPLPAHA